MIFANLDELSNWFIILKSHMFESNSIQPFIAIQTVLNGLMLAYIAYKQWILAQDRFKLDLFEKRYKVFEATRKFLSVIFREGTFQNIDLFEFYAGTADATFLFKDDITSFLDSLRDHASKMRSYARQYSNLPVGDERTQLIEAESAELKWLTEQLRNLATKFHSYLGFTK